MYWDLFVYFFILFASVLIGVIKHKILTAPFKVLAIIILLILISEITARILAYSIKNSNPPYHILCVVQYMGFSIMYNKLLKGEQLKKVIEISAIIFTILSVLNTLYFQKLLTFPSNMIMLSYMVFIVFSLLLFMQMLEAPKEVAIFKQSVFWFNCDVLVYSILMPVCFGVLSYFIKHKLPSDVLNGFIKYFTFLYYTILGYAIFIDKKTITVGHG